MTKNTTELVLLFHKNIPKLVFLWPNVGQESFKKLKESSHFIDSFISSNKEEVKLKTTNTLKNRGHLYLTKNLKCKKLTKYSSYFIDYFLYIDKKRKEEHRVEILVQHDIALSFSALAENKIVLFLRLSSIKFFLCLKLKD